MIRSMTGVGRAEAALKQRKAKLIVEIRSSNHKFTELILKLPTLLLGYESNIRELVSKKIFRGYLQLSVNIQGSNDDKNITDNTAYARTFILDYDLLANLLNINKELKERYKISGELNVNTVLAFPGLVIPTKLIEHDKNKEVWNQTQKTIVKALDSLNRMKREEGAFLYNDFIRRIKTILQLLKNIEKRSKIIRQELKEKIIPSPNKNLTQRSQRPRRKNMSKFSSANSACSALESSSSIELLNAQRAIFEELVRLQSHSRAFLRAIRSQNAQSVGRKLEFILSEMLRETETILAKGRDTLISRDGITIKEEVDALREQVRNVE